MYSEAEPYLVIPGTDSCWQTWHNSTVQRLHHRQTRSHGAEGWKDASEDNKWMIVQCGCAPFPKSLNPRNSDNCVSYIRIRILFPFESSFWISLSGCKLTILPDIQPANRIVIISASGYGCRQVADLAFLIADLAFLHLAFFWNQRKPDKIISFSSSEGLGSGKTLSELRIYYKSLLSRDYDHAGCKEYSKDCTAALKLIDVFSTKQMYNSVITGKEHASKGWNCIISMFVTDKTLANLVLDVLTHVIERRHLSR